MSDDYTVCVTNVEWRALLAIREKVRWAVSQQADNLCWMDLYRELAGMVGVEFDPKALGRERMLANCNHFVDSVCTGAPYRPDVVQEIRNVQEGMTDQGRLDLWASLRDGYCDRCGRVLGEGETCYCWRDE